MAVMTDHRPRTTTDAGIPAPSDEYSLPERVVHAKGGGAYGVLEMTADVSQYTKAGLFAKRSRRPR